LKDGWKAGCRRVIGIDGSFLTHTCKGELITAMGRDVNNQMFPVAWAVVGVENTNNWAWVLSLLSDDLDLDDGDDATIISDGHKGLLEAVRAAAATTIRMVYDQNMEEIRQLDQEAYNYLIGRDPSTWSRAFFRTNNYSASFENDISESFNSRILVARGKPIITMLEDIRLYIMQRTWAMSKVASECQDNICPSIRKQLEALKEKQRLWVVYPSGYHVMEVRKGDEAYGVNLINRTCDCGMWPLSGIPCVHSVAAYMHCQLSADIGVSEWYSQSKWYDAYQFSIKPVPGSRMWKKNNNVPPLPPIIRRMPGRPRFKRIRHPTESDHHVSRFGRPITCQNCWERGHNKGSCKNPSRPKPPSDIQRPMKRKLGGSSVPGKGDSTGPSKATKGVQGNKGGPSKATKGVQGNKGGPSKAKKGVQGNKGGPSKAKKGVQGKGKKVCHKGGINISEGQHMTPSQEELFRQDQAVLEEVIHEEERQKEMEWERIGRTYATWYDVERYNQDDPWEDECSPDDMQLFRYSYISAHEVQALSEAQAHGVQAPTAVQAAHEVQASSEAQAHGVQAPTAVQAAHEVQAPSQTS
ncbi:hypothetical protein Tco_1333390, partial [Tanacetum coccineum]